MQLELCRLVLCSGVRRHIASRSGVQALQGTWAAPQRRHLGLPQAVQGVLHAHLLIAPQAHDAGDGAP